MCAKSRHIPIDKYLECLSLEWMGAMVCHRILPSEKDKAYWRRVMVAKEAKIRDIAERNVLKSIFTDREVYAGYHGKRTEAGYPLYLPEKHINTYYREGRAVTFNVNGVEHSGNIISFSDRTGYCEIQGKTSTWHIHVSGLTVIV